MSLFLECEFQRVYGRYRDSEVDRPLFTFSCFIAVLVRLFYLPDSSLVSGIKFMEWRSIQSRLGSAFYKLYIWNH